MIELYTGVVICGAAAIISAVLCLAGQAMKFRGINRLLTCIDRRIQGKSARRSANRTSAKETTTIPRYQFDRGVVSSNYHNQKKLSRR